MLIMASHATSLTKMCAPSVLFANQAALAVHNAQRYQQLEEAQDRMITAEAVAYIGLMSSEWGHDVNQKPLVLTTT